VRSSRAERATPGRQLVLAELKRKRKLASEMGQVIEGNAHFKKQSRKWKQFAQTL
jgi:hypothetical protein